MDAKGLGHKIRKLRQAAGLRQDDLAKNAKVSRSTLIQLENGSGKPTLGSLDLLAHALGVTLSELLSDSPGLEEESNVRRLPNLRDAIEFLRRFRQLPNLHQRFVLALVFEDESYLAVEKKLLPMYQALSSLPEKA